MYTDEDLKNAVDQGIFAEESVDSFRAYILQRHNTHVADEENFRLIAGFNDIFVVIACVLLLLSSGLAVYDVHPALAAIVVSILSWGLSEFFVLKRKMALPAVVLLAAFVGGVFASVVLMYERPLESAYMVAAALSSLGAWLHWKRFKVPITVAAGAVTLVVFTVSLLVSLFPLFKDYVTYLMFAGGVAIFFIAMRWDTADLKRITGKSDVAFWLHLTAAPLIVHPVFSGLGVLSGDQGLFNVLAIITLYVLLTFISLVIDRRAFMVSSLVYVIVALTELLKTYGIAGNGFAYVGVSIGFSLLLLSGFWHRVRRQVVTHLPQYIRNIVPLVA